MNNKTYLFVFAALLAVLSGCADGTTCNTSHPMHGEITLTTDWSQRGQGLAIPQQYTVNVGTYSGVLQGTTNVIPQLFDPGNYTIIVYNTPDGITITNNVARVNAATRQNAMINPMPGWLFTFTRDIEIERDRDYEVTAVMQQRVRELTLSLMPQGNNVDNITGITATLSGVAGSYDIDDNTWGTPSSVPLVFTRQADGRWSATARLLGIAGNLQTLSGTVSIINNQPATVPFSSDLSSALANFNQNMSQPISLQAITILTSTPLGVETEITDWEASGSVEEGTAQ